MPAAGLSAPLRSIAPRARIERPLMADSATGVATSDSGVRVAVTMIVSCAFAGEPFAAAEIADSQAMLDCMVIPAAGFAWTASRPPGERPPIPARGMTADTDRGDQAGGGAARRVEGAVIALDQLG